MAKGKDMNTQHKYAKEICHWANGGKIQFKTKIVTIREMPHVPLPDTSWTDYVDKSTPNFDTEFLWRIKPEILRYKVALMRQDDIYYFDAIKCHFAKKEWESDSDFVKWLTDWTTVEI